MQSIEFHASQLTQGIVQCVGEVERHADGVIAISTPAGIVKAQPALSCLLQPHAGDTVLIALHQEAAYVLAVLARTSDAPLHLRLSRVGSLDADGPLTVRAPRLALQTPSLEVTAERVSLVTRATTWIAEVWESTTKRLAQISETVSLHAKGYQRHIENMELVRVGHLDLRAKEVLNLHARHAIVKSTELVKIDGKQIQVG